MTTLFVGTPVPCIVQLPSALCPSCLHGDKMVLMNTSRKIGFKQLPPIGM